MILADTSIWIEFLRGHSSYFPLFQGKLEKQLIVSVECVFGELLQGARDHRERALLESYWESLPKREEKGLWISAGRMSSEEGMVSKGIGLIDAFLLATARQYGDLIWTLDRKLDRILKPTERFLHHGFE